MVEESVVSTTVLKEVEFFSAQGLARAIEYLLAEPVLGDTGSYVAIGIEMTKTSKQAGVAALVKQIVRTQHLQLRTQYSVTLMPSVEHGREKGCG